MAINVLATARRVSNLPLHLSESPVWDARRGRFVFVDINTRRAFTYASDTQQVNLLTDVSGNGAAWHNLCAVIPSVESGFVAIGTQGIMRIDEFGEPNWDSYVKLHDDVRLRFNDVQSIGGRLFGGTIDCAKFHDPIAAFGEITPSGFKVIQDGHVISNGLALSPDGKLLFHIESTLPFVSKYDRNPATGTLTNHRPAFGIIDGIDFFKRRDENGAPLALGDGMAAANYYGTPVICVAEWGLGRIGIYDPATKQMVGQIDVPVTRPTSLAFGGDGYMTIFITSEKLDHDAADNCGLFTVTAIPGLVGFAPTLVNWPA